jgi:homoserine kinase type II
MEEARALLGAYDLGSPIAITPIPAGSVNSNYRLVVSRGCESRALFVRLYEEQGPEGARYDGALLLHLARAGVVAPCPIARRDGELVASASGRPAAIFPFVVGVHSCQRAVDEARARAVGAALAAVHLAGASFPERRRGRFGFEELRKRIPTIARAEDAEIAKMAPLLLARIDHWLARRAGALPEGVIHGDLFRDNVLFACAEGEGHDRIVALLDFESASDGPLLYDLAVCLLAWCNGDALEPALMAAMVNGYRGVRPFSPGELEGLRAELSLAALRFTVTRITDYALRQGAVGERVIKDWRRFFARFSAVESMDLSALSGGA